MERPTSVTVFGILNIVFAAFGFFGIIGSIVMFFVMDPAMNPMTKIMQDHPAYASWLKLMIPVGFVVAGALLAAGIGLLRMKNWARQLSIGYGIYAIISGLVGTVINYEVLLRPMLEQAAQQSGPAAAGAIGGAIGGTIGGFLGLIYPVLLIIFMTRPKVVAAIRAPAF